MDRDHLARLLAARANTEAVVRARTALDSGAGFAIWPGGAPATELLSTYRRRYRTSLRTRQESIGFETALDDLDAYPGPELGIGYVDDRPSGGYYFQLFLEPDFHHLVACLAVRPPSRDRYRPP